MGKIGISVNSLFPIDITAAIFSEVVNPGLEAPLIELDGNLRMRHLKSVASNDFVARVGVRSLKWRWEGGWKLKHYRAINSVDLIDAVSALSLNLAKAVEGQVGEVDADQIMARGEELTRTVENTQSRDKVLATVIDYIFVSLTNRKPTIRPFEATIRSARDMRFSRLLQFMKEAGEGDWRFYGGGRLIRWHPALYSREVYSGFSVGCDGHVHLTGDGICAVDNVFAEGWFLSFKGPLKYLGVRANNIPHLPWYFQTETAARRSKKFHVVEYISPPVTTCPSRQNGADRWVGPSGYSLIDYDHVNCRALLSALIEEKVRSDEIVYWQSFLTKLPASAQRVMKSQKFINGWVEGEIHRNRQPVCWNMKKARVEELSKLMLGPALIEHAAIADYLRATCWRGSKAKYAQFNLESDVEYVDASGRVNMSYLCDQFSSLVRETIECLSFFGCPRFLYMNIEIGVNRCRQVLEPGMLNMSADTQRQLMISRRAMAEVAKLYYGFMSFFLSTVLKADSLILYLLLGKDAPETIMKLVGNRSKCCVYREPKFWTRP